MPLPVPYLYHIGDGSGFNSVYNLVSSSHFCVR